MRSRVKELTSQMLRFRLFLVIAIGGFNEMLSLNESYLVEIVATAPCGEVSKHFVYSSQHDYIFQ